MTHNWVTFFRLVKNYIHFSYLKCIKVVTEPKIDKFGEEDEKCCIRKCDQGVTYLQLIRDPFITHLTPI